MANVLKRIWKVLYCWQRIACKRHNQFPKCKQVFLLENKELFMSVPSVDLDNENGKPPTWKRARFCPPSYLIVSSAPQQLSLILEMIRCSVSILTISGPYAIVTCLFFPVSKILVGSMTLAARPDEWIAFKAEVICVM